MSGNHTSETAIERWKASALRAVLNPPKFSERTLESVVDTFVIWLQGIFIRNAAGPVEDVRFLGFKEKLMQVCLHEDKK
jgi:hypothetical protein